MREKGRGEYNDPRKNDTANYNNTIIMTYKEYEDDEIHCNYYNGKEIVISKNEINNSRGAPTASLIAKHTEDRLEIDLRELKLGEERVDLYSDLAMASRITILISGC